MTETSEARPLGRPSGYSPDHCERVIALGKEGKSRAQIASALDISRMTLLNWEKANPAFFDALTRANDESLAWWEQKGQDGIDKGSSFNATLWMKCVSGRFPHEPYRERVQLTGANDGPVEFSKLTPDERRARIAQLSARMPVAPVADAS
jgi:hypothetical protein